MLAIELESYDFVYVKKVNEEVVFFEKKILGKFF